MDLANPSNSTSHIIQYSNFHLLDFYKMNLLIALTQVESHIKKFSNVSVLINLFHPIPPHLGENLYTKSQISKELKLFWSYELNHKYIKER